MGLLPFISGNRNQVRRMAIPQVAKVQKPRLCAEVSGVRVKGVGKNDADDGR